MILKFSFANRHMLRGNPFAATRPVCDTFVNVYDLYGVLDAN